MIASQERESVVTLVSDTGFQWFLYLPRYSQVCVFTAVTGEVSLVSIGFIEEFRVPHGQES